jgi:hypothetical protein
MNVKSDGINYTTLFDHKDLDKVFNGKTWHVRKGKYVVTYNPTFKYLHNLIMNLEDNDDFYVVHKNGDTFDNRSSNLQLMKKESENCKCCKECNKYYYESDESDEEYKEEEYEESEFKKRNTKGQNKTFKKGSYYIGDLCYVKQQGARDISEFFTRYGDAIYKDQFGNIYTVDSGTIGCIDASKVSKKIIDELSKSKLKHANIIEFNNDFVCRIEKGVMYFGHIIIDTNIMRFGNVESNYVIDPITLQPV